MPWNLWLIPLAAGYFVLTRSYFFKFQQKRLDAQRIIFNCVLIGVFPLVFTFILKGIIDFLAPQVPLYFSSFVPGNTPFLGTTLFCFFLTIFITEVSNFILADKKEAFHSDSIIKEGNELELIFLSSLTKSKLLQFTLDSGKCYIGLVIALPVPSVSRFVRIIPMISGYRDDKLKLHFTTQYLSVYKDYFNGNTPQFPEIKKLDVDMVLPLDKIVSVAYFDIEMYEKFNKA
jgi:hypothetical protein